jgi:hypothetical protein
MAITAVLILAGHNRLRYFVSATVGGGEAVEITSSGAATPDLITDSLAGPVKQIARVKAQGYGKLVAGGALTQAQARALLLSQLNLSVVGPNKPTAICRFEQRSGAAHSFFVDADVGSGDPLTPSLLITAGAIGAGYLEIEIPGSIGV